MATLNVEIPDELDSALRAASARLQLPEMDLVRELLKRGLTQETSVPKAADRWLENWRGQLRGKEQALDGDERLSHLLSKHLR